MRHRGIGFGGIAAIAALALLGPHALPVTVHAQGGEPEGFEPPRTPWGDPDFRGYYLPGASQPLETRASDEWRQEEGVNRGQGAAFSRFFEPDPDAPPRPARVTRPMIIDPPDGKVPLQPWAAEQRNEDHGPPGRAGPPRPAR